MTTITPAERRKIAADLQVHEQYLYQWLTRRRPPPMERCPAIERATQGRERCELLRPDVAWHRLPDAAWPWHPEGRPLIDVARNESQEARHAA